MESTYPISFDGQVAGTYDEPQGTVYIVNGAAGQGFLGPFYDPQPEWSAWREHIHGYSRLKANPNILHFDYVDHDGNVVHSITLGEPFKGIPYDD